MKGSHLFAPADVEFLPVPMDSFRTCRAFLTFTYRHAWSNQHNGRVNLRVTGFFGIRPDWNVFVSAGQARVHGDATAGMFIGAARFTVNNVAPESDAMLVQLTIEWDAPLSVITDYLVVPF
jgi:hypothetical protein